MSAVYIGTVIANSDISDTRNTEALGRVLVSIRNKSDTSGNENFINPFGSNIGSTLTSESLERLKRSEVWAYVLQPNSGGALGSFNPASNYTKPHNDSNNPTNPYTRSPAAAYSGIVAAGNNGTDPGSAANNTYDNSFAPDNRDGAVKGTFSVPPIGATVAVSFINGSRGLPVVIGTLMGTEAIKSIHSTGGGAMPGYPGATQGIPGPATS